MANNPGSLLYKGGPFRRKEREIVFGEAQRRPGQRVRETRLHLSPEGWIGIDSDPLAADICYSTL
jgi:hypothetical protein